MKTPRLVASMMAIGWALLPVLEGDPLYERPVATGPAAVEIGGTPRPGLVADYALLIQRADNPMVAISAFARGLAVDPSSVALHRSYLHRMVADRLPGLAVESAAFLATADPPDGLAWAVLARACLRDEAPRLPAGAMKDPAEDRPVADRDSPPRERGVATDATGLRDALIAIVHAVRRARNEPFVLQTAGEVLAALDAAEKKPELSEALSQSLAALRKDLANDETFLAAFKAARLALAARAAPAGRSAEYLYGPPAVAPEVAEAERQVLEKRIAALGADAARLSGAMLGEGSYRREDRDSTDQPVSGLTVLNFGADVYRPGVIGWDPAFTGRSIGYGIGTSLSVSGSWSSDHTSGAFQVGSPWAPYPSASYYGSTYGGTPATYGGYYGAGSYLGGPPYIFYRHLSSPSSGPTGPSHRSFIRPFIGHRVHSQ